MSLVDFKELPLYSISPCGETPILTRDSQNVYNNTWGYFTFQQDINFEYNPRGHYKTLATFTINGVFTANTSPPGAAPSGVIYPSGYYEAQFNALKEKYNYLADIFSTASASDPPPNLNDFGTAIDNRVVELPEPLRSTGGGTVYGRPVSLEVAETQWPSLIKYTAVLSEVAPPDAYLTIDDSALDDAVLTIKPKKPRIRIQKFPFANSEEIYFGGFDPRNYEVTGILPSSPAIGALATSDIQDLVENLMDGRCNIGKKIGNTITTIFPGLFIDQSSVTISKTPDGQGTQVSISATDET